MSRYLIREQEPSETALSYGLTDKTYVVWEAGRAGVEAVPLLLRGEVRIKNFV